MTRHQILTTLLAIPLVLMVWGSLRDAITPVGYWATWLLWAVVVIALFWRALPRRGAQPVWVIASFGVLVAGMVLSGLFNHDMTTLYQALKITVIGALFIVMWRLVIRTESQQLINGIYWAIIALVLGFFISKVLPSASYTLGGGREGYILAMPGVIWKAGAFFLPVLLADLIVQPRRWVPDSLAIAACVFLVLIDRSRTGLLLLVGVAAYMSLVLWWRGEWRLLIQRPRWIPLAAACLVSLLLLDTGVNIQAGAPVAGGKAQMADIVDEAFAPVIDNRLGSGDAPRIKLLRNGLAKSEMCFPLGCGFGSTAIDPGDGIPMNVHNAYLGALADFGLVGLLGMLGFIAVSLLPIRILRQPGAGAPRVYFVVGVVGSAVAYCITLMLHTFTSEMSEWGYLIVMLAFAWAPESAPEGGEALIEI